MFRDTTGAVIEAWGGRSPFGFRAGDVNLYRFVENDPVDMVDPTGLEPPIFPIGHGPIELPWQTPSNARPLGGIFKCPIDFSDSGFKSQKEIDEARKALYQAAERIHRAQHVLNNQWVNIKKKYEYFEVSGPDGKSRLIKSKKLEQIDKYRDVYIERLNIVYKGLLSGDPRYIRVARTEEKHPDRNPMYTAEYRAFWIDWFQRTIALRIHFWNLNEKDRAFWLAHEYARFFLQLDDDTDYDDGQGVQQWDDILTWLEDRFTP
jgi:hypothetical protein